MTTSPNTEALIALKSMLEDIDEKTICTATSEDTFIDEGIICASDHVPAIDNAINDIRTLTAELAQLREENKSLKAEIEDKAAIKDLP